MATQLPVDLTTSFAQRAGGDVRLVLGLPERPEGAGELRLTSGKRRVTVPLGESSGDVVEVRVPKDQVTPGLWKLALVGGAEPVSLEARLLSRRKIPVALLPGPTPTTKMAPPEPQEAAAPSKARRAAARTVDTALGVLPEQRRGAVRERLAKVGRRVLR